MAYELDPKVHPKLEERRFFGVLILCHDGFLVVRTGNGYCRRFGWRVLDCQDFSRDFSVIEIKCIISVCFVR